MNKAILFGMTALALGVGVTGCTNKRANTAPPPVADSANPPGTALDDSVDLVELPQMQADLIAKAGSDTVYFATDASLLDDSARATLAAQARWMLANTNVRASIEGHADERGTREYNLALGERRANAAKQFLIANGVPEGRLTTISWGKEKPVALGSNEQAWAQNRRAVTVIVR